MRKKIGLLVFPALLLAGCNVEPRPESDPGNVGPADAKKVEWEKLPEGKNYLVTNVDSAGIPTYTPVAFLDTLALIEDDIIVASGKDQVEALRAKLVDPKAPTSRVLAKSSGFVRTSAMSGGANAWPNGCIPYLIGGGVVKADVESAVYEFNLTGSGITFVPRKNTDAQGVVFMPTSEQVSSSAVGLTTPGQWQPINLISNAPVWMIMHEMGHAAGMYHEHSRPDRNNYVSVTTSGIDELGMYDRGYSIKYDGSTIGNYDYLSIMHYRNGTVTFTNPDNSLYKVTLTALNGQSTSNYHLSDGDKVSVWNLPVNQNPFISMSTLSNAAGKVIKPYFTIYNNAPKRWLLTYDQATGNSNVTALNDDNSVGNSVQNMFVGSGFNIVLPYTSGSGAPCMLFYSTSSGQVKLYSVIAAGGALNYTPIVSTYWNTGWTTIETYEYQNSRFWFFQNASNQLVNIWAINNDGSLGPNTYSATWPGWVYSKPFYAEFSPSFLKPYFLFRTSAGLTRIREMSSTGTLGANYIDQQLPNYTTVGMWQSVGKGYLALASGTALMIYDFDNTGFRTTGSTIFRAAGMGRSPAKIETASYVYAVNNSATVVNNKWLDFKHIAIMNWSELPGYAYVGSMAPFH